jgi:hypothetical protein
MVFAPRGVMAHRIQRADVSEQHPSSNDDGCAAAQGH